MRNHHVMRTFGRDFGNYRSGHTSTFCRDYFSSHRKAGAQGIRISRMSTVLIVSIQISKGWFALRITYAIIRRGGGGLSELSCIGVLREQTHRPQSMAIAKLVL